MIAFLLVAAWLPADAAAAVFPVTRTDDPPPGACDADCSLREAVIAANAASSDDTINLPAGTYELSIAGTDENAAATGDLDVADSVTSGSLAIAGAGVSSTTVDANDIDRVFHALDAASASLSGLTIRDGNAGDGSGILNDDAFLTPVTTTTITDSAVVSGVGDGVANGGEGDMTIASTIIEDNAGGGVENEGDGTMTITETTIIGNDSGLGGGILNQNQAAMTIADTAITDNSSGGIGGGILNQNQAAMTIETSTISGNSVTNGIGGGGIMNQNQAVLTIGSSTISGNSMTNGIGGGGIFNQNQAALTIGSSTISGNSTAGSGDGGALFAQNQAVFSATNTTISGNSTAGRGGAAIGGNQPTIELRNSTVAGNSAGVAGGGFFDNTSPGEAPPDFFIFATTIVAGNTVGGATSNCVIDDPEIFASEGDNLEDANTCGFNQPSDLPNGNAALGPLADNGGPTRTRALLPGSQALDAVDATCPPPAIDQRGVARPQGPACDIGAFELQPPPSVGDYDETCFSITINGAKLQGGGANDKLTGTPRSDRLRGGGGKDKIKGLEADDCLFGQRGGDKVRGGDGDDIIRGGSGKDKLTAGKGDDNVRAQNGNDRVKGGPGDDRIKAQGRGRDKVKCGSGNDQVIGDVKDKISGNCEKVKIVDPN